MEVLNGSIRNGNIANSGKKARKKGLVPGVLYGKEIHNLLFEIGEMEICNQFRANGVHSILNLCVDGQEYNTLVKEVQRDPVSQKIIHLDLEEIEKNKEIECDVPIQFVGEDYLNNKGQILQKEKGVVKISCSPEDIPKKIKFDIGRGMSGDVFRVCDMEVAPELTILDKLDTVIASVSIEKKLVSMIAEVENEIDQKAEKVEKK